MPPNIDNEARDMALEARDVAKEGLVLMRAHLEECNRREERHIKEHEETVRNRHELRNDMVAGFIELRNAVSSRAAKFYDRLWTITGALVLVLLGVIGYLSVDKLDHRVLPVQYKFTGDN